MKLRFTKMHGLGNDYVVIESLGQKLPCADLAARLLCNRRYGVGADGLLILRNSDRADFKMRMFNPDGSESEMCGNGVRCAAKYLYDNGLTEREHFTIETKGGIKPVTLTVRDGAAAEITVEMGTASLRAKDIPAETEDDEFISQPMLVRGEVYLVTGVSMGNPHAVTFCEELDMLDLAQIGPLFERHELFPERTNVEFIEQVDPCTLKMRVWERGCGETLACGTGACAAVAAAVANRHCEPDTTITVRLPGGELQITCTKDYQIRMSGPAEKVFAGEIELPID